MKVKLIVVGESAPPPVQALCDEYQKRLKAYTTFELLLLPASRKTQVTDIKKEEGERLLKKLNQQEVVVLLDELGSEHTSKHFAAWIEKQQSSVKQLTFVIGGAYGFSPEVYARARHQLCLSKMTLPHLLARVLFLEQLYRAFTILRGEKYHHD